MRVIFAGGKDVGANCFEILLNTLGVDVVGVFVNPGSDIAQDRWYRSIVELVLGYRAYNVSQEGEASYSAIPLFAVPNINDEYSENLIRSLSPDLLVLVYFDQILKENILGIPRHGCINLHMALSEEYRGCFPTVWPILNGEDRTGVTLHYVDEGVDSGDIIAQKDVPITPGDTGRDLYRKCTLAGTKLFCETLPLILRGNPPRRPQAPSEGIRAYPRKFPSHEISWQGTGKEIYDHIRAIYFPPFPLPYFYVGNKKMVIIEENLIQEVYPPRRSES